jgi:hypothetical protein
VTEYIRKWFRFRTAVAATPAKGIKNNGHTLDLNPGSCTLAISLAKADMQLNVRDAVHAQKKYIFEIIFQTGQIRTADQHGHAGI